MGPELCQVLYRSASGPSRGFWEEKRTCPRNSSSKVPVHPGVQASPPCPAIIVLLPSAGEQPGWHQMSPWGVLVPPRMGWGKRGTKLTSFPCFIHDYSRQRCWILILVHMLFFIVRNITHIISTWDHDNKMATDADTNFWFCRTTAVFEFSRLFFQGRKPSCVQFSQTKFFCCSQDGHFGELLENIDFFVTQGFHWKSEEMYEK